MKKIFSIVLLSVIIAGYGQTTLQEWKTTASAMDQKPILVAHRGGSDTDLPENSLGIINYLLQASKIKPVGVEIDIRQTKSGRLVLMHDATLERTTNGTGDISNLSDGYIDSLFLKDQHGSLTTEKIPAFEQVLDCLKDQEILVMLDVKGDYIHEVIQIVKQKNMEKQCLLLTFSAERTDIAIKASTSMNVSALITNPADFELLKRHSANFERMVAYIQQDSDPALIKNLKSAGLLLLTDVLETKNKPFAPHNNTYYQKVILETKVDILVTDFPLYVREQLFQ